MAILGRQSTHSGGPMLPRVVIIGTRGSFKRTIACSMAEKLGVVHVNMDEVIAQALQKDNELGRELNELSSRNVRLYGKLVVAVLEDRLLDYDCLNKGWVLTGFPRDHKDFAILDMFDTPPNRVIFITNNSLEALERVTNRRINIYTGEYKHKDEVAEMDDVIVKEQFVIHPDDELTKVIKEQKEFDENVQGMLEYCRGNCIIVDGSGGLDAVTQRVFKATLQASPPGDHRTGQIDQADAPQEEAEEDLPPIKPEKSILGGRKSSKSALKVAFDAAKDSQAEPVPGPAKTEAPSQNPLPTEPSPTKSSTKVDYKSNSIKPICIETSISGIKLPQKAPPVLKKSADLPPYDSCTSIFPNEVQLEWSKVRSKAKSYTALPPLKTTKNAKQPDN